MFTLVYWLAPIVVLAVLILITYVMFTYLISAFIKVPYVPTKHARIKRVLAEIKPKKTDVLYDLGSGDGRVIFVAVKAFGLTGVGIEANPLLVPISKIISHVLHLPQARFELKNILKADISNATIIYVFLFPDLLDKLAPKLENECKKGTIIISHGFKIKKMKKKLFKTREEKPFNTYYYRL